MYSFTSPSCLSSGEAEVLPCDIIGVSHLSISTAKWSSYLSSWYLSIFCIEIEVSQCHHCCKSTVVIEGLSRDNSISQLNTDAVEGKSHLFLFLVTLEIALSYLKTTVMEKLLPNHMTISFEYLSIQ